MVASDKDSGLEKAERSTSSAQGRRWEKPLQTESERWAIRARKAGVAIGGWDWMDVAAAEPDWAVEMGRIGGAVEAIWAGMK